MTHLTGPSRHDLQAIARRTMVERGLLPTFSPEALAEVAAILHAALPDGPDVRDLRALLWCSIDNDDSRDLDQLSVAAAGSNGAVTVLVAIADVDSLVARGSAIDAHARTNTTSVYTDAEIFPMLPERLSTDLTSLGQDAERLAIVVEMTVNEGGVVTDANVTRALVKNHAKLAYDSVAAWLEGTGPAPARLAAVAGLEGNLRLQDRAAQALREVRHSHGALELETIEAHAVFENELLAGLRRDDKNRAKELIEDLMIAANGVTAKFLTEKDFPSLRRVLRAPKRWDRIVALAAESGEKLPPEPSAPALAGFLARRRHTDPTHFPDLSLAVVKLLGAGEYDLELPGQTATGHFGLAVADYTHSTAPNRRFADLVTQRLLKAALAGHAPPYTNDELAELARHCTEQADDANRVERQVRKSAAALLLQADVGRVFDAIVTGASDKGTWVRTLEPPAEGKLVRGTDAVDVGDKIRVQLINADVERGFIDFARVKP